MLSVTGESDWCLLCETAVVRTLLLDTDLLCWTCAEGHCAAPNVVGPLIVTVLLV